jgi:hypothetical protein
MITVTTTIHKYGDPDKNAWKIHLCVVDFGPPESPLMFSSATSHPSAADALAAARLEAMEKIRARGGTESEDEITWKVQSIP